MLVTGSTLDSRVPVWHPLKYVAKLRDIKQKPQQRCDVAENDQTSLKGYDTELLLKVHTKTGHGGEGGRYNFLANVTFEYGFIFKCLGLKQEQITLK